MGLFLEGRRAVQIGRPLDPCCSPAAGQRSRRPTTSRHRGPLQGQRPVEKRPAPHSGDAGSAGPRPARGRWLAELRERVKLVVAACSQVLTMVAARMRSYDAVTPDFECHGAGDPLSVLCPSSTLDLTRLIGNRRGGWALRLRRDSTPGRSGQVPGSIDATSIVTRGVHPSILVEHVAKNDDGRYATRRHA